MKFWEALREMERGAVCGFGADFIYRVKDGVLESTLPDGSCYWEPSGKIRMDDRLTDWRIVTPAPSEAKPEPHANDCKSDTFGYLRGAPYPKPDTTEDVSMRMRVAKLENDVCELRENLAALEASNAQDAALHQPEVFEQPAPVAWPVGSLQWAELEAKKLGRPAVRRRTWGGGWIQIAHADELKISNSGRHALDWEPCE